MCDTGTLRAFYGIEASGEYHLAQSATTDGAAERDLAALIQRDLGVTVSSATLRIFIRANWRTLSNLAHRIHKNG